MYYEEIIRRRELGQRTFAFDIDVTGELTYSRTAEPFGDGPLESPVITGSCEK